jgi:hypothetical protein
VLFYLPEKLEPVPYRLFRFFPDAAGVQQYQVGLFIVTGSAKSIVIQNRSHDLAVREVHLAAVAFDVEFPPVAARFHDPCFHLDGKDKQKRN